MNSSSNFRSAADCRIDRLCAAARMVALFLRRIGIVLLQVTEDASKYPIIIGKELAPKYKSPEKARGIDSTGKADIWALGMTLLEMVGQVFPHSSILDITAIEKCIASYTDADILSILDTASIFSEDCRDFLKRCLRVNPEERASIAELLQHPFVTGVPENAHQSLVELLESLKIVVLEKMTSHTQPPPPPDCQRDFRKVPVRYEDPKKDYDPEKRIGKGGSGTVYSGFCKQSHKHVAIKKTLGGDFAMHEVSVWSAIPPHPNVVGLIEVFIWENYVYAVMELMSSNLASIIPIPKRHMPMLPSPMILRIIRQLICALHHLHTNYIAHGDIKSDNVLLDADGNAKLADFGVSTQHGELHFNAPYCGTFSWKSPDAMTASQSPFKGDIWSLGITIMELFGIDPPFFDVVDQRELIRLISNLQAPPPLPDLKNYGEDFELRMHGLLQVCFCMDPAERFSAEELLELFDMIFPDVSLPKN